VSVLRCSPRQLYEASRLADRCGDAIVQELHGDRVLVLLATHGARPDLALELDHDGNVVARQYLDLAHQDHDDGLDDFGDEQELPYPVDLRHARPAPQCECPDALGDDGLCHRCGRTLPAHTDSVAEVA
jgi:hypothetical protein